MTKTTIKPRENQAPKANSTPVKPKSRKVKSSKKARIKTPTTYYGGKVKMISQILKEIPEHTSYIECFVGGGAIFWAKEAAKIEVVNDKNGFVVNFYQVLQSDFEKLNEMVQQTPHSRLLHTRAKIIYEYPFLFSALEKAWAFWCLSSQSFGRIIGGSWRYEKTGKSKTCTAIRNKKINFKDVLTHRLDGVTIECRDALDIIKRYDNKDAFHYIDPPYINSNQGHYSGYNEQNYTELLETISGTEGKFLLSSYPSDILDKFTKKYGWYQREIRQTKSMTGEPKVEVLTANYPLIGDKFVNEVRKVS